MTGRRRWHRVRTAAELAADADYRARLAAADWTCIHGVVIGSLVRPWCKTPACPLCRRAGWTRWRRLDTVDRIPVSYR